MESWRCFACLRITLTASVSLSSASASDLAIAAYFSADLSMRSTFSFVAFLARIASFRSESTRCCSVMRHNYDDATQLSICSRRPVREDFPHTDDGSQSKAARALHCTCEPMRRHQRK